jgi:CelD/BcsL family acetyltransferase involved in cellulose biosynthesis
VQTKLLQTIRIHSPSDLAPYLDAWRELAAGSPMRSPDWLLAWWEFYAAPDDALCILLIHEQGGSLVGLIPLFIHGVGSNETLRLLGSGNDCTHHTTWLSAAGWENQVGMEVARFLLQCKSIWKRLLFESVDADDVAINATMNFLAENGCLLNQRPVPNNWSIALPATWDDYLMMLSRSLRKRCRKLQRQFLDSGKIQVLQVRNEVDLQKGFEILLRLHGARWGSAKKPDGVFDDQKFRKFHETVSRNMLARDKLRLAWLEYNGRPIAVEYQFFDNKTLYAYQAGVDLSMNDFSPGKLSMMASIQFALTQGCKSFDLLSGDEPYKANWRATSSACHDLRAWQGGMRARAEWVMRELFTLALRKLKPKIHPRLIKLVRQVFPR